MFFLLFLSVNLYTILQASSVILAGLGMAAVGFAGRYVLRQMPNATTKFAEAVKNLPKFDSESLAYSKYYKGGFEPKMTKREAALILGVSPTANKNKVSGSPVLSLFSISILNICVIDLLLFDYR